MMSGKSRAVVGLMAAAFVVLCAWRVRADIVFQGGGDNYVAVEAEKADTISGTDWRVVSIANPFNSPVGNPVLPATSNASGAEAILHDFGTTGSSPHVADYRFRFATPGTYRLYVRDSAFEDGGFFPDYGNEDSFLRPLDFNADPTTNTNLPGYSGQVEGTYGWRNTNIDYTVTSAHVGAPFASFPVRPRETGFSLDRMVLSTNTSLTGAQLGALGNSLTGVYDPVLYYSFEPPDVHTDSLATDYSGHHRDGTLSAIGTGSFQYQSSAPAVLPGTQSLLLTEDSTGGAGPPHNAAHLSRTISTGELDFDTESWTFSGWFNRASDSNDADFILHLGAGDGYGGGNELYVVADGTSTLALHHYFNDARQVDISATGAGKGQWHHVAVVHDAAGGAMSLFLNGGLVSTDTSFGMNLSQSVPLLFGGHTAPTFRTERWFDGGLDDLALWSRALSAGEIELLAGGANPLNIPEPATFTLLALGGLGILIRRRRKA